MDIIPSSLLQPLMALIFVATIATLLFIGFFIKLAVDLSNMAKSIESLSMLVKYELEPTIKELHKTLTSVNSIASNADRQVNNINKTLNSSITGIVKSSSGILGKALVTSASLVQGVAAGIKAFSKKRK